MQLNKNSDYTLRVLLYLSVRLEERSTLSQISSFFDISLEHLRKVVHQLSKMGYINTFQGKGGGIELAHPPEKINIGEVLRQLEGLQPLINCSQIGCRLSPMCTLSAVLGKAQHAFFNALSEYSLADLIENEQMIHKLANLQSK